VTGSRQKVLRPRLVPSVLVALLTGLLCWLGTWQLQRAGEKRALLDAYEADDTALAWRALGKEPPRYARVWLEGEFDAKRQVLLDGVSHKSRAGYQVLTPLRMRDGRLVVVNRGWRQWHWPRDRLPELPVPPGRVRIEGRIVPFVRPGMRLSGGNEMEPASWPRVAVYPSAEDIGRWLGESVAVHMVLLDADQAGGFVREWRPAAIPPSRHIGYALQWYALALALVVLFLVASRREREAETN